MKTLIICMIALTSFSPLYAGRRPVAHRRKRVVHRVEYGEASWYGGKNQGRLMACGLPFDENAMVAANRTLPLGTTVKVTNLRNGRSVMVRIMDRGPWVAGRVIDLSRAAARRLGFTYRGLAPVKIRVVSEPSKRKKGHEELARNGGT
jgi:rare lipoprotein A